MFVSVWGPHRVKLCDAWTFGEVCNALAMSFIGSECGNCLYALHHATDAQVAGASSSRENAQLPTGDLLVASGILQPVVDAAR